MRVAKHEIPVKFDVPGAVARQADGFGDPSPFGALGGEYFTLASGTDIAPLLKGLEDDACQAPHWGYMLAGALVVTYVDGSEETCSEHDLFYWPAGHSVRVVDDAEVILFSPHVEHTLVLDHMHEQMAAGIGALTPGLTRPAPTSGRRRRHWASRRPSPPRVGSSAPDGAAPRNRVASHGSKGPRLATRFRGAAPSGAL